MDTKGTVLALSGGVGGAKLALGLARVLPPEQLTIVCNTGDDFQHLGLSISPDVDTVLYSLAGLANRAQGWGLEGESWQVMQSLEELGGETWFRLGDRDLATHLFRTSLLQRGFTLTEVCAALCESLGIAHSVVPMSDDSVTTRLETHRGELAFQDYFVRQQCQPVVKSIRFAGAGDALPSPRFAECLDSAALRAVLLCPSNPYLSIDPILSIAGLRASLRDLDAPVVAVCPIVGGQAIKGPSAKIMQELGVACNPLTVAEYYSDFLDVLVIDEQDREYADAIEALGVRALVEATVMQSEQDKIELASKILHWLQANSPA